MREPTAGGGVANVCFQYPARNEMKRAGLGLGLCSSWVVVLMLLVGGASRAAAGQADYRSSFDGERTWAGPDFWTARWQDWSVSAGRLSVEARANRSAVLMTHDIQAGDGTIQAAVEIAADQAVSVPAGLWMGVNGPVPDWRSAAAYGEYRTFAGVRPDGTLVVRTKDLSELITSPSTLKMSERFRIDFRAEVAGEKVRIVLRAIQAESEAGRIDIELPAAAVVGLCGMGTADLIGETKPTSPAAAPRWHFREFTLAGTQLHHDPGRTYGPIGWMQYTVYNGILKLSVLMVPIGVSDNQRVQLQFDRGAGYQTVAEESIDALSRSAHFRIDSKVTSYDVGKLTRYRVRYEWNGKEYFLEGTLRPAPAGPVKIAVMSCDRGYAFPNLPITAHIKHRHADLLLFLGDQIYEPFGNHGIERRPLDRSTLDYLRKYALFGWVNRELLANTPSIIIPDDHDVFQGNLWGAAGRAVPRGGDEMGGYQGEADWVNVVQRTQSWHLPDAYDPTPVERGITVHYNQFSLGNVSFAVLEDRKWKTGFRSIWPDAKAIPRGDLNALDAPGAQLLGERQEQFLSQWAQNNPDQIHVAISATIFAKTYTHTGPELNRNQLDFDTNGWPRTARNRAVAMLGKARALHLVGDQHVGILAQLGVDNWTDGPLTFMGPGTANGWPRAWWPETPGENRRPGDPEYTGRYVDPFGNQFTILAAANPESGSNKLTAATHSQEQIAEAKSSGFGLVTIDPLTNRATFEMWRYSFDAAIPQSARQFNGFPQTFERNDTGWQRVNENSGLQK